MKMYRVIFVLGAWLLAGAGSAWAADDAPGIDKNQILIGSCSALDGPASFLGRETVAGASAYLHHVNSQGGVNGRKIQLLAFDDGSEPAKTAICFKRLLKENVLAADCTRHLPRRLPTLAGHAHGGQVRADGARKQDAGGGPFHWSRDALFTAETLRAQCPRVLL